jgi:hypothetical protein
MAGSAIKQASHTGAIDLGHVHEDDQIAACAAGKEVDWATFTVRSGQSVVPLSARQVVLPTAPGQGVVARSAEDHVGASTAI